MHVDQQACAADQTGISLGVENELLVPSVYQALQAVRGLAKGRTEAVESKPVKPVPLEAVEAIRPHVSRQIWAMIQIQLLTGARPGEVVLMRTGDLNTCGSIWLLSRQWGTSHLASAESWKAHCSPKWARPRQAEFAAFGRRLELPRG